MADVLPKIIIILFSIVGIWISAYLYKKKKRNEMITCPLDGDCTRVVTSSHGKFFGIDITLIGIFYYSLTSIFSVITICFPQIVSETVLFIGFLVSFSAFLFSLYLIVIQAFVLKQWCTWCLFSTFIVAVVFGLSLSQIYTGIPGILTSYTSIVVIVHAFAAALGVGAVTLTDIFFFKFLRDYKISEDEADTLGTLSEVIWFALVLLIVTGIGLYLARGSELLESSKFLAKMGIVGVLIINGILLNLIIAPRLVRMSFGEDDHGGNVVHLRKLGLALGAVSIISWYVVFILGSLRSIPIAATHMWGIYMGLIVFGVIGSQWFDHFLMVKKRGE